MKKLILSLLLGIILLTTLVSAQVYEDNLVRYGTIDPNGVLTPTTTPINNANFIGFVCSSNRCGTVSSRLWPGVLTTPNDYKQLIYPTILQSQYGYAVIVYKDGYIPFGINADWAGNGVAPGGPFYDYLTKKEICGPHLLSETVTNNCKTINVVTTARAPISKAGVIDYYPQEIANQFTSNVDVTLEVRKDNILVHSETKHISLFFSEEKDVSFSYVAQSSGTYSVKIIMTTDEPRCLTHASDTKTQDIIIPACCGNTDCGTDIFSGNPFCQNGNVFQNFITFNCVNPGQANSYCTNSSTCLFKQDCGSNSCTNYGANYCKNNNVYKSRTCTDRGCCTGSCTTNTRTEELLVETCSNGCNNGACIPVTITCSCNSNCGTNGFVDGLFCQNGNVFQNFITFTCNNPGQANSYCSNSTAPVLKQTCPQNQVCQNGACVPINITCSCNSDCGQNGFFGSPFCNLNNVFQSFITFTCVNPGQANSYCTSSDLPMLKLDCGTDSCNSFGANYCKNNSIYHSRTCHDKGCDSGNCFDNTNTDEQKVQDCTQNQVCSSGSCIPINITCTINHDCGTDGFVDGLFCQNGNVFQNFITFICNNPGQANSYCTNSTTSLLKQTCSQTCLDGSCIEHECTKDTDCGKVTSELFCSGSNLMKTTTTPTCTNYTCNDKTSDSLVEKCVYGCDNGKCKGKPSYVPCLGNCFNDTPQFIGNQNIDLTYLSNTTQKLQSKNVTETKNNSFWLWFLIILFLILLIILLIVFILGVLGTRHKRYNKKLTSR